MAAEFAVRWVKMRGCKCLIQLDFGDGDCPVLVWDLEPLVDFPKQLRIVIGWIERLAIEFPPPSERIASAESLENLASH